MVVQQKIAQIEDSKVQVLGVEESVCGKKWIFPYINEREVLTIAQKYGVSDFLARLLVARDISLEDIPNFLSPSLKNQLPDPYILKDMEVATTRLADAIIDDKNIAVFGDYDVDGATSTALLKLFFKSIGKDILVYIPDRIKEGYGPNSKALLHLKNDENIDLLLTVDCGISAFKPLEDAKNAGLEVIVFDHHTGEPNMPPATAIVNPNRFDETSELGHLAAAGVVFLAIIAINRILRERNWYKEQGISEPKLMRLLDIVALGTVCDVVPLKTVNRAFVSQGLKVMAMRQNLGIRTLSDVVGIDAFPSAFHLGFMLGPRINAGGRVGEADTGTRLLSTENVEEAKELSHRLNFLNTERREIEADILEQAIEQVEAQDNSEWCIIAHGENWHPGVIGIVASRLKDRYNRPACVIAFDENGVGKASARSVNGVDLGSAIISARNKELLVAGGGHKMAAGFTVMQEKFEEFQNYLSNHIKAQRKGEAIVPTLRVDTVLSAVSVNMDLLKELEQLAPFGMGNSEPRIVLGSAMIIKTKVVGENHIQCFIKDSSVNHATIKAIAFRALNTPLGDLLMGSQGKPVHLAGHLNINRWNGKEYVNFQIVDGSF